MIYDLSSITFASFSTFICVFYLTAVAAASDA